MDTYLPVEIDQRLRAMVAAYRASSVLEAVRLLVRAGVPVFPCVAGGKRPLTRHGFQDATTDPNEAARMWRRWPDANLAIPTGRPSGWDVVDVDVHDDASGRPAFDASLKEGLTAGWAFTVRTPSGGLHAYFPNTREQTCWACPDAHVDFRSDGGYVVVPPSRIEYDDGRAGAYQLATVATHAPGPVLGPALRTFITPRLTIPAPEAVASSHGTASPERLADWVAQRPEGGRNSGLFWAACRLAEHGHDYDTALATIGNAALHAGLPPREAAATIRSAFRRAHQRVAPPVGGRASHTPRPGGARRPHSQQAVIS